MSPDRLSIFCLVPEPLESELLEPLRDHFSAERRIHVIVDRRVRDRRAEGAGRHHDRRRGTDRRRPALPRWALALPPHLEPHRESLRFVQRLPPLSNELGDLASEDLVRRVREGDDEAPAELYWRCYPRIHSRLTVLLGDPDRAADAVGRAFGHVLDALETAGEPVPPIERLLYPAVDASAPRSARPAVAEDEEKASSFVASLDEPNLAITDPLLDEPVVIKDHDDRWLARAQSERDALLRDAGREIVAVEHVGSTAVAEMAGRPIVDLLVGVDAMPVPEGLHAALLGRGYEDGGDAGTPGRAYYRRRGALGFDVHVVEHDSVLWAGPLALRDHLRDAVPDSYRWSAARREAARRANLSLLHYTQLRAPALAGILALLRPQTPQGAA